MRRSALRIGIIGILAIGLLIAVDVAVSSYGRSNDQRRADAPHTDATTPPTTTENAQTLAARMPLLVDPPKIDLGKHSPCDGPLKTKATVTNRTSAPVKILRTSVSCACTQGEIDGAMLLGPGESRTLDVTINLIGEGGKSQRLTLVGGTGPLGMLRVDYEIVPVVMPVNPAADVGPEAPTADIKVVRADGKPLKLLSVVPENLGTIETRPDGSQVAVITRDRADAYVESDAGQADAGVRRNDDGTWISMYMLVVTDYPGCPNASVLVRRTR